MDWTNRSLLLITAIGDEGALEMLASLARVNSTLDLSTSDIELRAVAVDTTVNGTSAKGLEVELARDRDPADGVRVANKDFILLELFKGIN